jgi:GH24 family phage-related lysozyme (muramidase)
MEGKGNPDPATFVESYINLEKLVGADPKSILRVPKEGDAEATAKFYNSLGRPETVDKYTPVEALKNDPLAKAMAPVAYELGLTDKQWSGLQAKLVENTAALTKAGDTASAGELAAQQTKRMEALADDIGKDKMPEFVEDARRAVRTAVPEAYKDPATGREWTRDQINEELESVLGKDLALRIFSTLGKFQAEDKSISGTSPASGVMTPEAAQERWNALQRDTVWVKGYLSGGLDQRREAEKLALIIAAGKQAA